MMETDHGEEQGNVERPAETGTDQPGTADDNTDVGGERYSTTGRAPRGPATGLNRWTPTTGPGNDHHVVAPPSLVDQSGPDRVADLEREEAATVLTSNLALDRNTNASGSDQDDPDSIESLLGATLGRVADAIDDLMMETLSEETNETDDAKSRGVDYFTADEETADRKDFSPVTFCAEQTPLVDQSFIAISQGATDETSATTKQHGGSHYLSSAMFMDWPQPQRSDPSGAVQTVGRAELPVTKLKDTIGAGRTNINAVEVRQQHGRQDAAAAKTISDAELATETYSTENDDAIGLVNNSGGSSSPNRPRRRGNIASFLLRRRSTPVPTIAPSRPARVEPKSFFANERTFIQWVSIALLLATIDSLAPTSEIPMATKLRVGVTACAGVLIVYSVSVYYWRLSLLSRGAPYGYTDRLGPVILVTAVLFGGASLFFTKYGGGSSGTELTVLQEDRDCHRYYHGMSPLEYEPSDVTVQNNVLLIPSHSTVTAISTAWSTAARTLITLPGTDIEAIGVVDDRLFVVSESSKKSNLIELAWNVNKDGLDMVGNWTLDLEFIEGLTYIPGGDGDDDGQLFYGDDQGRIYATAIPALKSSWSDLPLVPLNHAMFRRGLVDAKIAALQYLDGLLYVLHDNAGVVRGWDLATGELLSEWTLPVPPDSFGTADQIEGFFLERTSGSMRHRAKYLMHLTVDTPAQIWTIAIEVDHANGHVITYPACARGAIPTAHLP